MPRIMGKLPTKVKSRAICADPASVTDRFDLVSFEFSALAALIFPRQQGLDTPDDPSLQARNAMLALQCLTLYPS
jgi:hypothetical protein